MACFEDVSRDNPFDPVNGSRNFNLSGHVLTFYQPQQAIPQASILVQPGNLVTLSDQNGFYTFNNLIPGDYTLVCQKEGYHTDSATINIQQSADYIFLLDGLPQFEQISIKTHHRSRWFPLEEIYYIEFEIFVNDPDGLGDIHSVNFEIPSISFSDTLEEEIDAGKFSVTLFDFQLPVTSIHQLIGRQIYFSAQDDFGSKTSSDAIFLTRIIEMTPHLLNPTELELIEAYPIMLEWERVSVPYPATLKIEIFQINFGIAFKVDEIVNIQISEKNYMYAQILNSGDYFWTINIVDEFGNSSSSREGTFHIK